MAKSRKQLRHDRLNALEAKRHKLDIEWNALRAITDPLTATEIKRKDVLRQALDQLNSEIVRTIIDETS